MGRLDGKIALVTGGNGGIGLATAKQFVSEGAYVFITGRRKAELEAAVGDIAKNVSGVQGDVANLEDLDRLFARIKQDKGKLDIVFANAGVARYSSLGEITPELYDSIFNINVKGLLFTVQKALPLWLIPLTQVTPNRPSARPSGLAVATDAQLHGRRSILSHGVSWPAAADQSLSGPLWSSPELTGYASYSWPAVTLHTTA